MSKKFLSYFIAALFIFFSAFLLLSSPSVYSENQSEAAKGIQYLKSQTHDAWVTMALAGNDEPAIDFSYLQTISDKSPNNYAKHILALTSGSKNPTNFGSENYVEKIKSYYQNGQFGDENLLNDDIWAILALGAVGQENSPMVQSAKDYILDHQNNDGGWGYNLSGSSDTNDTAAVIMALLEANVPPSSSGIQAALTYLKSTQNADGGFSYAIGLASDSCSNAWVASAIYKLGQDPQGVDWKQADNDPLKSLKSFQDVDGGFWWKEKGDNKFCTAFAVLALLGKSYPVETVFNSHQLRIEGNQGTICDVKISGATAMDLIVGGSKKCGFSYTISEYPGMGLYLAKINDEPNWMYMVNNLSPLIGAENYHLGPGDDVLWYSGDWLNDGWFASRLEVAKDENNIKIQAQFFDQTTGVWQNLEVENIVIKVGNNEFKTNGAGLVEMNSAVLGEGLYQVFLERQVVEGKGYIRSHRESLKSGDAPSGHQVGMRVKIEKIAAPDEGNQSAISFSVSPDNVDFGTLRPGQSATTSLMLVNGPAEVYLETEISGANVFGNNLSIEGVSSRMFAVEIKANKNKTLPLRLAIPPDYSGDFGLVKGEITFWATKK